MKLHEGKTDSTHPVLHHAGAVFRRVHAGEVLVHDAPIGVGANPFDWLPALKQYRIRDVELGTGGTLGLLHRQMQGLKHPAPLFPSIDRRIECCQARFGGAHFPTSVGSSLRLPQLGTYS